MTGRIDRDELRKLADDATPGPWEVHGSLIGIGRAKPDFGQTWGLRWRQDIEFICAARAAVPALLDEGEQAEKELDYWMTRAYAAEKEALDAGKRIQAVRDVLDEAEARIDHHPAYTFSGQRMDPIINGGDIRRALDGEAG